MWKHRQCNNPKPSGDGKTCKEQNLGADKESKACNTQKCGEPFFNTMEFKQQRRQRKP